MKNKRWDLQAIRGIAIVAVLLFHFFPDWFPNGYIGVDQFFVLSGYLIAMILWEKDLDRGTIETFYYRRIKRIVPLYILVVLLILISMFIFFPQVNIDLNTESARYDYQGISSSKQYTVMLRLPVDTFTHLWSLAVEMQFYLLVPLIFYASKKFGSKLILVIGCGSVLYHSVTDVDTAFNSVFARLGQFCIGIVSYIVVTTVNKTPDDEADRLLEDNLIDNERSRESKSKHDLLAFFSYFCLGYCLVQEIFHIAIPSVLQRLSICVLTGIFIVLGSQQTIFPMYSRILVYMGDISYALYLVHWPLYSYVKMEYPDDFKVLYIARFCSICLAVFITETYEKFYLKLEKRSIASLIEILYGFYLVRANDFDDDEYVWTRMAAGVDSPRLVSFASFLHFREDDKVLAAIRTRSKKALGRMVHDAPFSTTNSQDTTDVFLKWLDIQKAPRIGKTTASTRSEPVGRDVMAHLKEALKTTNVLKKLLKDDAKLQYYGDKAHWLPTSEAVSKLIRERIENRWYSVIIQLANDILSISSLHEQKLNADCLINIALIAIASLVADESLNNEKGMKSFLMILLTANISMGGGNIADIREALKTETGPGIGAVVAEIAPWKITHTAVVDAAPAMPPGAPEKKEQQAEKQTKEKEAARTEEKKAAEAEAHAVQGNETRGDPDEEQPIQAARDRRSDVTRMVDAAKRTEVGLMHRNIAVASSSNMDCDVVQFTYGGNAHITVLWGPQLSQLRDMDGIYLLKCCREVIIDYTVAHLLQTAVAALNDGGFLIIDEDMATLTRWQTTDQMTQQFKQFHHTVDGKRYGFQVQGPELVQAPGEVFWTLVKREILDGPAKMKRAIPTDAAQGNGHDTHHRGCTTINYHISGGSQNIAQCFEAAPAMPPGAPRNDCSTMPSVMPVGTAAKPAAKTRSIPSVGNPEKTANQEKADKDKADKPAGAAPGATPKAAEAPKEGAKEGPKEAAAQQQPQVATVAANGGQVVQQWVQRALDMGVDQLRNEYKGLAKYTLPDMTVDAFKANHEAGRNRYQEVPCQDQCRVVNKWPGAPTDYVHANYVGTPLSAKRFVCTQGPLDTTVNDFWMMVVQEEAETIVMLCNCVETGKLKCAQYWPQNPGEVRKYDAINFEITNKEMRVMSPEEPTVIVSILSVKFIKPGGSAEKPQTREVRHYQWQDWPDRGVPPCKLTAMELLSRVRGTQKPIIVHCSAGIGRTGTIVAIEYILEHIQAGVECATMCDLLKELRNQRAYTIHNDLQYLHIHRVMLCYFLEKHKARYEMCLAGDNAAKYEKFVKEYDIATTPK